MATTATPERGRSSTAHLGDETEMNMTPMIDIVFQLIVFFLLTLRFKTIDRQIEAKLPKDRGPTITRERPEEFQKIKVKLFRRNPGTDQAFTRIRIGNDRQMGRGTFDLPAGEWPTDPAGQRARLADYDRRFHAIGQAMTQLWEAQGKDPEVRGEIVTDMKDGGNVPHGDIMRVLDTMVQVGLEKIAFEGAPPPLGTREGGFLTGN